MDLVQGHGFVHLGVPDLDAAIAFYTGICRLTVTEQRDGAAFLTGGTQHHWLRLEQSAEPGLIRLGYQAVDAPAVEEVARRLEKAGVAWSGGGTMAEDRVRGGIRFRDPFGLEVELYQEMLELPAGPPRADLNFTRLLHAVAFVSDVSMAEDFYVENLGFRRSDRIEDLIVFLRAGNRYHHSLALGRGDSGKLDHFAILVEDIDDVMRMRTHAGNHNVLGDDVVRHAASGSISVYLRDELTGIGIEYCTWHGQIDDDSYNGRLLKASPRTVNMWADPFPGEAGATATARTTAGTTGGTKAAEMAAGAVSTA